MLLITNPDLSNKYDLSFVTYVDRNKLCLFVCFVSITNSDVREKAIKSSFRELVRAELFGHGTIQAFRTQSFCCLGSKFHVDFFYGGKPSFSFLGIEA